MTRKAVVDVVVHTLYYFVVIFGGVFIIGYFILNYSHWQEEIKLADTLRYITELSGTAFVDYASVESLKKEYRVGEPIYFLSERWVKPLVDDIPTALYFEDTLFCALASNDRDQGLYSQAKFSNSQPELTSGFEILPPRQYPTDLTPQEPAECYGRHIIKVCPFVDNVPCKPQTIISGPFQIVK